MDVDADEICKDDQILLSLIIAALLLFIYFMTSSLYQRAKRMRSCNFVSIELPPAVFTGKNLTGVGSSPSKMPTLPSLFLTSAEIDAFSNEPAAAQRNLVLTAEESLLLRAESRSGYYVRGKELTLFKWKYSDYALPNNTVTREFRTGDGTVEITKTAVGATMNTADTLDVERRYRRKGSKMSKEAEAAMEFN